ncbi:MAG TPA: polysaccharide biosynthesis C-terminal domain-containing protein [Candidatus Ornithomonoglobus intestinigallinarum]|uniref:Polysaccharide biosynthesis C-terminal domain-containing protein n=1 Tax=Candidatus Ornithomonoglobus intestinigallinarum TaxID=2840894 RepID=A0A9D1KQ97_9FIRM|nr:polysaccharide biosynthesis C-terminal domain-containing protein [Candidatus Ornithomonoglobus intestinigallinarum]
MNFKLSRYIVPSVVAMVVVGTNTNIDGFFIGNILGDDGLAAINIVWPIVAFIVSVGTGIGVGGSVLFNARRGSRKMSEAETAMNTTLVFLAAAGLFLSVLFPFLSERMLALMGAEGAVLSHAHEYALVIGGGAVFQVAGAGLLVLLRNCGKAYQVMIYSVLGLAIHLVLDIFLAEPFGMAGVAAATVISQLAVSVLSIISLSPDRHVKAELSLIPKLAASASAPFGLNFVPSLALLFTNYFALRAGGVAAVSAYAVMSYAVYTFDYIFQGICDGVQPVISYCMGADDKKGEARAMKTSALILAVSSALFCALTPLMIKLMPGLFAVSDDAHRMMNTGFVIYAFSYPCKAAVKYVCSYYYSCGRTKLSNLIVYLDPLVLTPGLLLLLSELIGTNGVWLAMTSAQLILAVLGIAILLKTKRVPENEKK